MTDSKLTKLAMKYIKEQRWMRSIPERMGFNRNIYNLRTRQGRVNFYNDCKYYSLKWMMEYRGEFVIKDTLGIKSFMSIKED